MLRTSGPVWVKAILLSTGATALMAALLGLLHLRIGGAIGEPTDYITICDCILDDSRQTVIAMIRKRDGKTYRGRRMSLLGLKLSSSPTRLALPFRIPEPISVAAGRDGQLLVAAIDGGVYSINPKRPCDDPALIIRHKEPPFQIVCSSDGRWLLTVESKQSCLWDLRSRELRWRRKGNVVCAAAFVPGTAVIVAGMADGSVAELSLETGDELRRMHGHSSSVVRVTVSSQGDRVASSAGQDIRVTDRQTGASIWQYCAGKCGVPVIKFSSDGRQLVTAELKDCRWSVQVWDLENLRCSCNLNGHVGAPAGAEFLSDDELLTWSAEGEICRWSLADSSLLQTISAAWLGS